MKGSLYLMLFLLVSCVPNLNRSSLDFNVKKTLTPIIPELRTVTFEDLKTNVLTPHCISCHEGMKEPEGLNRYMVEGHPDLSSLYHEVAQGKMPKGKPALDQALVEMIKTYISAQLPQESVTFNELRSKVLKPAQCMTCHKDWKKEIDWEPTFTRGEPAHSALFTKVRDGHSTVDVPALKEAQITVVENFIWNAMGPEEITFNEFKDKIITPYCIKCHKKMDEEAVLKAVVPKAPHKSRYYLSIKNDSMPKGGAPLSKEEKRFVRHYILKLKPQEGTSQN